MRTVGSVIVGDERNANACIFISEATPNDVLRSKTHPAGRERRRIVYILQVQPGYTFYQRYSTTEI
jgi:hypothetical protein